MRQREEGREVAPAIEAKSPGNALLALPGLLLIRWIFQGISTIPGVRQFLAKLKASSEIRGQPLVHSYKPSSNGPVILCAGEVAISVHAAEI